MQGGCDALGKNSENFGILKSHNQLSVRNLHNQQLFTVDNGQVAALRLAVFQSFRRSAMVPPGGATEETATQKAQRTCPSLRNRKIGKSVA
jgi:hypothetical protein